MASMKTTTGKAHARVGLLGNPSDGYEGQAIAFCTSDFAARVTLETAGRFEIVPGPDDEFDAPSVQALSRGLALRGCDGGVRLLRAAIRRFAIHWPELERLGEDDPRLRFRMRYETSIPRQVGLAGSSAIVIAALRALLEWFDVGAEAHELAELALAAEVDDLGIAAGPMDRVAQAYEDVLHMDFAPPRTPASYARLDPKLLPVMYIAWDPRGGEVSGRVHSDVRSRWTSGDPQVLEAMRRFRELVDEGIDCLQKRDLAGFRQCVDRNFDMRATIWKLTDRDQQLVAIGRSQGSAVKFCGSGGSVIGVPGDASELPAIERAYRDAGYELIRPSVLPTTTSRA
ncbi:MAG: GHMP kinase [bacterium]|nr:GHMP kinase [bacterium]